MTVLPKDKSGVWMGVLTATCELFKGKPRKILISSYGAFLNDVSTGAYYQIPEDRKEEWQQFLNETSEKINKK